MESRKTVWIAEIIEFFPLQHLFIHVLFPLLVFFAKGNGLLSDQKKIFEEIGCINSFPQRSTEVGPHWCPAQIIREAMLEDELFEGPWRNRVLNAAAQKYPVQEKVFATAIVGRVVSPGNALDSPVRRLCFWRLQSVTCGSGGYRT